MNCPLCGKVLTPASNDEDCPKSLYWHGKHPVAMIQIMAVPIDWNAGHKYSLKRFIHNLWKRLQVKQVQ